MIYVDPLRAWPQKAKSGSRYFGNGKFSCHMATDQEDLTELHAFAKKIGLQRSWFQDHKTTPHYDLTPNKRALAVQAGAVEIDPIGFVRACSKVFRKLVAE